MKIKFILILSISIAYSGVNFQYNGKFSHFYAIRNSTNKVLNIPFRMLELNSTLHLGNSFEIKTLLSTEYHNTNDDYFNSKNISHEIRELYGTYYFNSGEISFGKKLFTLGSVDENSPIDHFNPYNYYYLLMGGTDKKIGVNSLSFELYLGDNYKISAALSPEHNTNYYPQNDPEYELGLSIQPEWYDFLENKGNAHESFLSIQKSNNNSDFTLTYLRAFDRVFSLSGFAVFLFSQYPTSPITEIKYSHRLTEAINLGSIFLLNDLTIRSDIAYFHSFDRNSLNDYLNIVSIADNILCDSEFSCPDPLLYEIYIGDYNNDGNPDEFRLPLSENVCYSQINIQLELSLPRDFQLNIQFFRFNIEKYKTIDYELEEDIDIPMAQISTGTFFIPGIGSAMATLASKSVLFSLEKYLLDNDLKITFSAFFDQERGNGKLLSLESEYTISDNLDIIFGITDITGDNTIISESDFDNYGFNLMEDFSHKRIQLNYYF